MSILTRKITDKDLNHFERGMLKNIKKYGGMPMEFQVKVRRLTGPTALVSSRSTASQS